MNGYHARYGIRRSSAGSSSLCGLSRVAAPPEANIDPPGAPERHREGDPPGAAGAGAKAQLLECPADASAGGAHLALPGVLCFRHFVRADRVAKDRRVGDPVRNSMDRSWPRRDWSISPCGLPGRETERTVNDT